MSRARNRTGRRRVGSSVTRTLRTVAHGTAYEEHFFAPGRDGGYYLAGYEGCSE